MTERTLNIEMKIEGVDGEIDEAGLAALRKLVRFFNSEVWTGHTEAVKNIFDPLLKQNAIEITNLKMTLAHKVEYNPPDDPDYEARIAQAVTILTKAEGVRVSLSDKEIDNVNPSKNKL